MHFYTFLAMASYKSYNMTHCPVFVLYLDEEGICSVVCKICNRWLCMHRQAAAFFRYGQRLIIKFLVWTNGGEDNKARDN